MDQVVTPFYPFSTSLYSLVKIALDYLYCCIDHYITTLFFSFCLYQPNRSPTATSLYAPSLSQVAAWFSGFPVTMCLCNSPRPLPALEPPAWGKGGLEEILLLRNLIHEEFLCRDSNSTSSHPGLALSLASYGRSNLLG